MISVSFLGFKNVMFVQRKRAYFFQRPKSVIYNEYKYFKYYLCIFKSKTETVSTDILKCYKCIQCILL